MSTSRFFDSKNRRVSSGNSVETRVPRNSQGIATCWPISTTGGDASSTFWI